MTRRNFRPALAGLVITAALLALPSASGASTTTCRGHTERGADSTSEDHVLAYAFGCSDKILGYSLVFDQGIEGFEAEVPVVDQDGTPVQELMSCEGDIPSFGVGCFGNYTAGGHNITGNVLLERDACANPRYKTYLVAVTGIKGQTAGPFELRGPTGCGSHVSRIQRLLAWIGLLRSELKTKGG